MYDFTHKIKTKICFGRNQLGNLAELAEKGKKVLLAYGGGSIKKSGLYDDVLKILKDNEMEVFELSGIAPNPKIESVREGVMTCKENGIEMVLAVGGGSSIDCAKVVAAGAKYEGDPWDLVIHPEYIEDALPIYTVLTLSATGTEMDAFAVISDMKKNEKWGTGSPFMVPEMSILNPEYTYSVSKKQTAAGTADMISHTFENYFTTEPGELQKNMSEAVLMTCFANGPIALAEPDNYEARANLMWASSWAINGLLDGGVGMEWTIHPIEHELSAFYDITHGEGLAIMTPVWMEYIMEKEEYAVRDLARYGRKVWAVTEADDRKAAMEAIAKTKEFFFETMGIPATLRAVGIEEKENFMKMAEKAAVSAEGWYVPLTAEEIVTLFERAF